MTQVVIVYNIYIYICTTLKSQHPTIENTGGAFLKVVAKKSTRKKTGGYLYKSLTMYKNKTIMALVIYTRGV